MLLIVFMITAPFADALGQDRPAAGGSSRPPSEAGTVALSIDGDGQVFWNNGRSTRVALPARLAAAAAQKPQPELHLRADRNTR